MNNELKHPYWDQYVKLLSFKDSFTTVSGKNSIRFLARQARFSPLNILKLNCLLACPGIRFSRVKREFFCVLREQFAYSLFPPEVLEIVAALSPLVEVGAGNGYLAWLLRQMGADVVAFDAYPVEEGGNWFFHTRFGLPAKGADSWTRIDKGTSSDLIAFGDRTLVLCWPPKNSMAYEALQHFPGERLLLILEKSCCANKDFFRELERNWKLEYATATGSWSDCHEERLEVYSRKGTTRY